MSSQPDDPVFSISRRLAAFTETSALPLDFGLYAADIRWATPHCERKFLVADAVNSGPPSLEISIGTPNREKTLRHFDIRPSAPALAVPLGASKTSHHPDSRSPMTR